MKAVVMAGGEGSRLRPLTANRPKPMVPVCNEPIMEHILKLLRRHRITDVVATVHYLADEIQSYFGDGADHGVNLRYSQETQPLGTAGSVKQAEAHLRDGTFVIVSGDALTDCDLTAAIEFHRAKGSVATIVLAHERNPVEFGLVITDSDQRVVRFLEKPSVSEVFSDTVNTGMYILEPEVLDLIPPGQTCDWSGDIFPKLLETGRPMYGYVMEGFWTDIGSLNQYRDAHERLLSGTVGLSVQSKDLERGVVIGPNTVVDEGAMLVPPVCLGRNCRVRKGARVGPYTVLGDNTLVEEGAHVARSVIWDGAYIGPNANITSAIICSRATLKKDCVVREEAVVGDRCLLDVGSTVRPRVKIWPDKIVERGSTVTMSLIWGNRWRGQLFRELGVAGLSNIELTPDFACRLGSAFGSCFPPGVRIVTARDSTRSSRMLKRALMASILSVGCDVLDLRSAPVPIARHFIKASGAAAALNIRKLPGNIRVSLVEMFDARGAYLSRNLERKIESAFFREDFVRADSEDLGVIEFASRAFEEYQNDYFRTLGNLEVGRRLRVVVDYGYSALGPFFPAMLERLNIESISLNAFSDARLAPRTDVEIEKHMRNLSNIVATLGYDMGLLFTQEGERLSVVDEFGRVLPGSTLLAVMGALMGQTSPAKRVAMPVTAPEALEAAVRSAGADVLRTRADVRSLMSSALEAGVAMGGDERGGFLFPDLHPGFDAAYTFGMLVQMLRQTGTTLGDVVAAVPAFHMAYERVAVPLEARGTVMRRIAEERHDATQVEQLDGLKMVEPDGWVLVLPDAVEPILHLYAESQERARSEGLVRDVRQRVEAMVG